MDGLNVLRFVPSVKKGDVLCSPFSQYTVQDLLGCGSFGQVAKCLDMSTNNVVAVKILLQIQAIAEVEAEVHCYVSVIRVGGVLMCF